MVHALALKQKGLREDEYRLRLGAYGVTTCKDFKRPQFDAFVRDLEKLPDVREPTTTTDTWLPVTGWPYEVSDAGRVRNSATKVVLRTTAHKSGYLNVQLWNRGRYKTFLVHRLVASAFIGGAPSPKHEVAHGDGTRHNNAAENLRWVLHMENMRDRDEHGATARGSRNGKTLHDDATVAQVWRLRRDGLSGGEIARRLGININTVYSYISQGRRSTVAAEASDACA